MRTELPRMAVWMSLDPQIILEEEVFGAEAAGGLPQRLLPSSW